MAPKYNQDIKNKKDVLAKLLECYTNIFELCKNKGFTSVALCCLGEVEFGCGFNYFVSGVCEHLCKLININKDINVVLSFYSKKDAERYYINMPIYFNIGKEIKDFSYINKGYNFEENIIQSDGLSKNKSKICINDTVYRIKLLIDEDIPENLIIPYYKSEEKIQYYNDIPKFEYYSALEESDTPKIDDYYNSHIKNNENSTNISISTITKKNTSVGGIHAQLIINDIYDIYFLLGYEKSKKQYSTIGGKVDKHTGINYFRLLYNEIFEEIKLLSVLKQLQEIKVIHYHNDIATPIVYIDIKYIDIDIINKFIAIDNNNSSLGDKYKEMQHVELFKIKKVDYITKFSKHQQDINKNEYPPHKNIVKDIIYDMEDKLVNSDIFDDFALSTLSNVIYTHELYKFNQKYLLEDDPKFAYANKVLKW